LGGCGDNNDDDNVIPLVLSATGAIPNKLKKTPHQTQFTKAHDSPVAKSGHAKHLFHLENDHLSDNEA
jgi:hypothetical protein